jgi:hypothetical protein
MLRKFGGDCIIQGRIRRKKKKLGKRIINYLGIR